MPIDDEHTNCKLKCAGLAVAMLCLGCPDATTGDATAQDDAAPADALRFDTAPAVDVSPADVVHRDAVADSRSGADSTLPDIVQADIVQPDIFQPDIVQPDIFQPDIFQPDIVQPDTTLPDTMLLDTVQPDTMLPDTVQPDTMLPDTMLPDTVQPDTMLPDSTLPDTAQPDSTLPDTIRPDISTRPDSSGPDAGSGVEIPRLGVYSVGIDGSGLTLILDAATRQLSHVRLQPGSNWLTATRYSADPDGNGLAMEAEAGHGAHYAGTEVIVFRLDEPSTFYTIASGIANHRACANSSWTQDGKLIYLHQDHPTDSNLSRLKRASFSQVPTTSGIEAVATPPEVIMPVDPHQWGPSDASGRIVFTALYNQVSEGWMRPLWLMPANGTTSVLEVSVFGCPMCGTTPKCCGWSNLEDVLGTNDARFSHSGDRVIWMQQHPETYFVFGEQRYYPYRQALRQLVGAQQILDTSGAAETTTQTFGQWRDDDAELVYWSIEVVGAAIKNYIERMDPDGGGRQRIPLPQELCVSHPSYLSHDRIIFSGWHCGSNCSCAPDAL